MLSTGRRRFRREKPANRISLDLSKNYEAILNSIEEIDGESTSFSTVETLKITGVSGSSTGIKIEIDFRLFFNVWFNENNEFPSTDNNSNNIELVVDYESAEDIRITTNIQSDSTLFETLEKIPANDNDVINLLLDDLMDNWENVEIVNNSQ